MTAIDDIKPGMWVAIVADKTVGDDTPGLSPFDMWGVQRQKVSWSGAPVKVLAVSLPFIAVEGPDGRSAIDVRQFAVQQVTPQYVRSMIGVAGVEKVAAQTPARRKKKEKPDAMKCPRCGSRCVERLIEPGKGNWSLWCRQCGAEGRPVKPQGLQ